MSESIVGGNLSSVLSGAAYIDPNDFGATGYAALPVLLAVFPKVVVYSPDPDAYDQALVAPSDGDSAWWAPSWHDLESLALGNDPALRVVARGQYLDRPSVASRCRNEFRERVHLLDSAKWEQNAADVAAAFANYDATAERLNAFHRRMLEPPARYKRALASEVEFLPLDAPPSPEKTRLPESWEDVWVQLEDHDTRLLMLAEYDARNDEVVCDAASADRPFLSLDALFAQKCSADMSSVRPVAQIIERLTGVDDAVEHFVEILRNILPVFVSERAASPIDQLRRFRDEERAAFWPAIDDLFGVVLQEAPDRRIEVALGWARGRERSIRLPAILLASILPFAFAWWLSSPGIAVTAAVLAQPAGRALAQKEGMRKLGRLYCDTRVESLMRPVSHKPIESATKLIHGLLNSP